MVTKQNIKTSRAPVPHIRSKHLRYSRIAGLILLALLVIFIGFKTYAHKQAIDKTAATQKAQFDEVDTQMRDVMNQIEATAGQPYELHYGHGCSHAALKFREGPLSCGIYYNYVYTISIPSLGKDLTEKVLVPVRDMQLGQVSTTPVDLTQITSFLDYNYETNTPGFGCTLTYRLKSQFEYNNVLSSEFNKQISDKYAAEYHFSCLGPAVRSFYQLHSP